MYFSVNIFILIPFMFIQSSSSIFLLLCTEQKRGEGLRRFKRSGALAPISSVIILMLLLLQDLILSTQTTFSFSYYYGINVCKFITEKNDVHISLIHDNNVSAQLF